MFFPFRSYFDFTSGLTKRDIVALILVLMVWAFAIWSLFNAPVDVSKQKATIERTTSDNHSH